MMAPAVVLSRLETNLLIVAKDIILELFAMAET